MMAQARTAPIVLPVQVMRFMGDAPFPVLRFYMRRDCGAMSADLKIRQLALSFH